MYNQKKKGVDTVSKEKFKREFSKNGHLYAINEYGQPTKDGVVTEGVEVHPGTDNRLLVRDFSNVIGYLHGDFGYFSEPLEASKEFIGSTEKKFPDGEIDKISRFIYRDKEKGMFCLDHHSIFKADGVTKSEKREWYSEAAPFEYL